MVIEILINDEKGDLRLRCTLEPDPGVSYIKKFITRNFPEAQYGYCVYRLDDQKRAELIGTDKNRTSRRFHW